jgi:nucleotide-binding universal stress UspA family protein
MLPLQKILWPTDFSEPSYRALEAANELAAHFSAELILIHVVAPVPVVPASPEPMGFDIPSYQMEMEASAKESLIRVVEERISGDVEHRRMVILGDPANEIVQAAAEQGADIIVTATHGLTGWRRFIFGSVAEKVIRLAPCPVLSIQAPPKEPST